MVTKSNCTSVTIKDYMTIKYTPPFGSGGKERHAKSTYFTPGGISASDIQNLHILGHT